MVVSNVNSVVHINEEDEEDLFTFVTFRRLSAEAFEYLMLFIQQVVLILMKTFRQKSVNGRNSIKSTVLVPFFLFAFTAWVCVIITNQTFHDASYELRELPPLSKQGSFK